MTFNQIMYYLMKSYGITRKQSAGIAGELIKMGASYLSSPDRVIHEAERLLAKGYYKEGKRWKPEDLTEYEEKLKKRLKVKVKPKPAPGPPTPPTPPSGGDTVEGDRLTPEQFLDIIERTYNGDNTYAETNVQILKDILYTAQDMYNDEEITDRLYEAFPDIESKIERLANSIYDSYYGRDGAGRIVGWKRDVDKIIEALEIDRTEIKQLWW